MLLRSIGVAALLALAWSAWWLAGIARPTLSGDVEPAASGPLVARRLVDAPIVTTAMHPRLREEAAAYGYANVNGPSLLRVPAWVEQQLGAWYLYFAHHKGESIRLAVADAPAGPWRVHDTGALDLDDSRFTTEQPDEAGLVRSALDLWQSGTATESLALARVGLDALRARRTRRALGLPGSDETRPHVASPEVVVDPERRQIRMYFHGLVERRLQMTRVAVSEDGLHFRVLPDLVAAPYLRVFRHRGRWYGLGMPGLLYRSDDGLSRFEVRRRPLLAVNTRHVALWLRGDTLYVFHTRVGDAPERILCSTVDVSGDDWNAWTASRPFEVLRPEHSWEGGDLPVGPSLRGEWPVPVRQLRDPAVHPLDDSRALLLYAAAGEQAIGIAELRVQR